LPTGPLNAITDVPGVLVGHTTLDDGAEVHTGVTAIVPPGFRDAAPGPGGSPGPGRSPGVRLPAAIAVGNGYGKLVGSTQVDELGVLETPILLTGTLSVFRVADALVTWLLDRDPVATSLNPVVGETNDGFLSDIRRRPITPAHVFAALDSASSELPDEGCVGAGTGTAALGFKAGIGTSSRQAPAGTVGVLVQSNFSGVLTVLGTPVPAPEAVGTPGGNSCMIVVATDLPLDARQLGRVARRAIFAMGRVGSDYAPGSGDYAIAFSTATDRPLPEIELGKVFQATVEATEEALLNSMTMAVDVTGFAGNTRYAVPEDVLLNLASD
jgi:D-aminopeptidase